MSIRSLQLVSTAFVLLGILPSVRAVTVQDPGNVLPDGSAYLFVEGEDVDVLATADGDRGDPTTGYLIVDKNNPIQTITTVGDPPVDVVKGGLDVLPADTNASGGAALFVQLGSGGATTATWELQFAIPATYYLYPHWTLYNRDDNTNYGNEDSYYLPPTFNANSRSDWIGFEGVDEFGDPKTGDSDRDGYIDGFARIVSVKSGGIEEFHNSTDEDYWDGQFHWHLASPANDMDENNAFVSFSGHGIQYEVTPDDVGQVLTFQISTREPYGAIDALVFSTSNLLLDDFTQEELDEFFLTGGGELPQLQAGDANQDLKFDQIDLVQVQVAAKYLTGQAATWGEGDWNGAPGGSPGNPPTGDGLFNQVDIVAAQQAGKYLTGPYAAVNPAPPGWETDEQTTLVYNPSTGELAVNAPASTELTSINIDSAAAIFTGEPAQNLGGSFDNDADNNIFKATFGSSFGSLSFGNVAQTGLSADFVLNDLTVIGSLAGGGDLGDVDLVYVPEPATTVLLCLGIAGAVLLSQRRLR